MSDWTTEIAKVKKRLKDQSRIILVVPSYFNFKDHDAYDFDKALSFFDWSIKDSPVLIDFTQCGSANYQALSLIVLYAWRLKSRGCRVDFKGINDAVYKGAGEMWCMMGAKGLFSVAFNENQNFRSNEFKQLIAIRNHQDFKVAVEKAGEFSKEFNIGYINTLRYILSELLYNTLEHGVAFFEDKESINKRLPSLIQYTWYAKRDEIHFLIGDVGMGIKRHLSQAYQGIEDDEAALRKAIQPQVSGTFKGATNIYQAKNNAGMGLFLSTNIVRRLRADMHLVSGNAVLHVSPADTTTRTLQNNWPGTFALVSIKLDRQTGFNLDAIMSEFRQAAQREQEAVAKAEEQGVFYLSVYNYFGTYPEDKSAAIKYRDSLLVPAIEEGKRLLIDFDNVTSSPHSFLNALLATPIKRIGILAYKRIKFVNAKPDIRETIDFVLDDNVSES